MTVEPLNLDQLAGQRFHDVEVMLTAWIRQAFAALDPVVATEIPEGGDLAGMPLFVRVSAYGGRDLNPAQDRPNVDVDVFVGPDGDGNPDQGGANDVAELLRTALLFHLPGYDDGHLTVSAVTTVSRPTRRDWDEASPARRCHAAYSVVVKSRG